ncbi:MAG TPA: hypothetical protein VJ850_11440 [Candidatus Limnocylindrales bacterium]|nr:hypothetical protein [Candidatus Limnocylindrales bacterium]
MPTDDRARERQDNLRPEAENQAAAMRPSEDVIELGPPDESNAGESADTGAGTGGATESGGRPRHNEGAHLGNQPNS